MTIPTASGASVRYDERTALIVVDVQNDFADPGGSLAVKGGGDIVPAVNREIRAARAAGALVVYTADWHPAHSPHFAADGGIWPAHCVRDSWGAAFYPTLEVAGPVVRKGVHGEDGYSGFGTRDPRHPERKSPTELAAKLHAAQIEKLVVVGLASDYCVKATALDGVLLGWPTRVVRRAVRAVNRSRGDGAAALAQMRAAGIKIV